MADAPCGVRHILVNNARQATQDSILDITSEQFDWTVKTNLYATFWITKAAVPHLTTGQIYGASGGRGNP